MGGLAGALSRKMQDSALDLAGMKDWHLTGKHGPIFHEYKHDWRGAALALEKAGGGEAQAALYHPEIGDVDLIYGVAGDSPSNKGYGLAKIIAWHPEVLDDLQGRLNEMRVVRMPTGNEKRIKLSSPRGEASVSLDYNSERRTWLLTEYDKTVPRPTQKSMTRLHDRSVLLGTLPPSRD